MKTTKSKKTTPPTPAAAPVHATASTKTAAKAPVATPTPAPHREIPSEVIASRAYSLWEQQGRPQGHDLELWLQAEQQLKSSQSFAA